MATINKTDTRTPTIAADIAGSVLTLTASNGTVLTVDTDNLSSDIRQAAMLHGLKQKLVDAAAISRNPDTGASATVQDKIDAVQEVYDRITATDGTWNKIRGDGTGGNGSGLLVRALMAMFGKTKVEIEAHLDGCTEDERKALRNAPKVAAKMAELKAASSNIDTDALLAGFGA